jgi:hypothetical protein
VTQEYGPETTGYGLHAIVTQRCDPALVMIVGYSFGLSDGRCDDQLVL